ncbi:MAG: Flp pilus assembly protein CpaB [Alphaproteobacteria bacterium]|nr:Flp pilus assembly protein CpaB [Alphaproteobacteria bacterium]
MRTNSRVVILLIAALIAAFTAVIVRKKMAALQGGTQVQQTESKRILVARRDVPAGKFVDSSTDLDWVEPKGDMDGADVIRESVSKKSEFNGGVVRRALKAGKPIAPDEITKAGDGGFLSAVLEPGMRAVAIAVTATTGAAGFIAPGDRVDLIVTHRIKSARSEMGGEDTVVSETFVRDVRVVAVDQSLGSAENKAQLAKNVTVEVTESQAEQIAVAIEMGKISMALRSALTNNKNVLSPERDSTRTSDVIPSLSRKGSVAPHVQVIRGDEKEDMQFLNQGAR